MAGRDIIVIGTSFGGVKALTELVHGLPPGPPAALFVVCHFPADAFSRLPEILSRHAEVIQRLLMGPGEGPGKGANRTAEPVDSPPAPLDLQSKPGPA